MESSHTSTSSSSSSSLSLSLSFSSSSSSSSSSASQEIEAAQTLAYLSRLAMHHTTTHSADKCRTKPITPIPHSDHPPPPGQAIAGQQLEEKLSSTTSVETERIQQNDCLRNTKIEQDADLPKTIRCNKSRRNLTEEEKEARRIRRVMANRESARQTIRRRQALSEELSRKAATLVLENENLKRKKELALKEYKSLETTNQLLKAQQIAKSTNTEAEKTPVEQKLSVAEVAPVHGNSPWFLYNHFPVSQLFWPSILQSSNQIQFQHTPFNSIAIPSHVYVPSRSSESEFCDKQNNLMNDNQTQNPLYMFPCPWLYPPSENGNGQPPASTGLEDKQDNLPLESRSSNDPGHTTPCFSLDGGEQNTRCHVVENLHGPAVDCNGHASVVKQEPELQLHFTSNTEVSSAASHIATSTLEKKQEQFICSGRNLVDAVAAAKARKRRKQLTKLKSIQSRQSRMEC
uniref:Protein AF-9 isoform X2 n=1 Tax=Cicer arietinum TaxID=3827 RepID=A0A3Q7Y8P1_CICAR|nr:protein AF-9 isoform X2 [Cicer arietinum]